MPKGLSKKEEAMIASAFNYFSENRENENPSLPAKYKTAQALGISVYTVEKVTARINQGKELTIPSRKGEQAKVLRKKRCDFDKCAIRNVIYEMYKNREYINLNTLSEKLSERDLFNGGRTTLWRVLHSIGFQFKKDDPKRKLMELPHITAKRIRFLREYKEYKNENLYQFVFLDETWIFQNGTIGRSWQDSSCKSVKTTKVEGKRYIVLHAGGINGFIPGAELVFSSSSKDGDYHGDMNSENFLHWFEFQLLVNLPNPSVIIMDNASYHSVQINKVPTAASNKMEIQQWLKSNKITYMQTMLKKELLLIVKQRKPEPVYAVDQLAIKYGHQVLRLPPYHCIFNPIEHIWGITKSFYNKHIGKDGSSAEKSLSVWKEALAKVTPEVWAKTVAHSEAEIEQWWQREVGFDREEIEPIIIDLKDNDDDESSECFSEEEY